jgi:hypothetical protein
MNDHIKILRGFAKKTPGMPRWSICLSIDAVLDELERLRINEQASQSVMQKWAGERVAMTNEIERLTKLSTCGCGDGFAEHDPGICGNCMAALAEAGAND